MITISSDGAQELDIVQNISFVKEGNFEKLREELTFLKMANFTKIPTKMILETGLLTDEEIKECCKIYDGEVDFVKTSSGFANETYTGEKFKLQKINCVKLMKQNFSGEIKASGGIRDLDFIMKLIEAGATRIGCSSSIKLIKTF